jgi:hypothetical protein
MCIAMTTGNHLFPHDAAYLYYVFAIALVASVIVVGLCLLVAQHGALRVVAGRSPSASPPRMSWNLNLVILALHETQYTIAHNMATEFAPRQVYAAWQTLIALPALLVLDLACVKFVATGALWSKIMAVVLLVLVVGAHASAVILVPVLRAADNLYVNVAVGGLQALCTVLDIVSVLARPRAGAAPDAAPAAPALAAPAARRDGLFEQPVRSGVRHVIDTRIPRRRTAMDLRVKKDL